MSLVLAAFGWLVSLPSPGTDSEGGAGAEEFSELTDADAGRLDSLRLREGVDWASFTGLIIGEVRFKLDERYHARRYDPQARRVVDRRLTKADRKALGRYLRDALEEALDPDTDPGPRPLYTEPVITLVKWTQPPSNELHASPSLFQFSTGAGGAAVRIHLRAGHAGGRLVGSASGEYYQSLNDGVPRAHTWLDAHRSLKRIALLFSQRLAKLLA